MLTHPITHYKLLEPLIRKGRKSTSHAIGLWHKHRLEDMQTPAHCLEIRFDPLTLEVQGNLFVSWQDFTKY